MHDEPAVLTGGVQRLLVVVEDDVRAPDGLELRGNASSHAPEAADDRVVVQVVDRASQLPLRVGLRDRSVRDEVDDRARQVEEDCHASQQQEDREELRTRSGRLAVEPCERRRDDRAVEGRDPPLAENRLKAGRPDDEDQDERRLRVDEAPPLKGAAHGAILGGLGGTGLVAGVPLVVARQGRRELRYS